MGMRLLSRRGRFPLRLRDRVSGRRSPGGGGTMSPTGFIPNGRRPTLEAPDKPALLLPTLHERKRGSILSDPRIHRAAWTLALLAGLILFGYFVGWVASQRIGGP